MTSPSLERIAATAPLVGYSTPDRYRMRAEFLFDGIPLEGKNVLDVGCGPGTWALWAGLNGARSVLGIEPESAGSTQNTLSAFRRNVASLQLEGTVSAQGVTFQDLPANSVPWDVVVLYNVINHLDEEAVNVLHHQESARATYIDLLKRLRSMMAASGWVIVSDCARSNFWSALRMKSPFARAIEWHKHQNPSVWVEVFEQAGFRKHDLRWSYLYPYRRLTSNPVIAYVTHSHFDLRFQAV